MNDYKFGNFIYTLRVERGFTQAEIAQKLGVTSAAVSKWENGSAKPRYEMLLKLAEIFEVTTGELIKGEKADAQPIIERCDCAPKKEVPVFKVVVITLCAVILALCVFLIIGVIELLNPIQKTGGNTNANRQTYCMVVEHDGWIYYCDPFTSTPYLYKMRTDKSEKQCIVKDTVVTISVTDDWVYYSKQTIKDGYAGVYRIKHDGTQRELLASGKFWYLYATDEWIYCADGDPSSSIQLYRMKPDGTRYEQISSELCKSISITHKWIYYIGLYKGCVYKVQRDTGKKIQLESAHYITDAVVEDNVLYTYDGQVLRIEKLDGTGCKEYPQRDIARFNVSNGYIYIAKEVSGKTIFYKVDSSLKKHTDIFKMDSFFSNVYMCIIDDWLYFPNGEDGYKMYRVKTDGSGEIELVN